MFMPLIDTFLEICANNPLLLCPLVAFKVYIVFYNIGFDQTITSQILPTQVPSYFLYRLFTMAGEGTSPFCHSYIPLQGFKKL